MARNARISVMSPPPLYGAYSPDHEAQFEKMCAHLAQWIDKVLPDRPDLILLPEMCDSFHDYTPEQEKTYYRWRADRTRDFIAKIAREHHCYIAYGTIRYLPEDEPTGKPFRNSLVIVGRYGETVGIYDKNYPTTGGYELCDVAYADEAPVFELDFGRVCCAICFDLNFPELMWRYAARKPDLILFASMFHGGFVQQQWAYNCRAYLAASVAEDRYPDGSGTQGQSGIVSPIGEDTAHSTLTIKYISRMVNFDRILAHGDGNHPGFRRAREKYGPLVEIRADEGHLSVYEVLYHGTDTTMEEIARECGIIPVDEFFDTCRAHRDARKPC